MLRVLHTSDWHLGRQLHGQMRTHEFVSMVQWMLETIDAEAVDVLIIAGDIFDNTTPTNAVQTLYANFLDALCDTHCRHVIIIGGNHDSPTLLEINKKLYERMNIYIVGATSGQHLDEVLPLRGNDNKLEAVICAVPYLRQREICTAQDLQESAKQAPLLSAIEKHYAQVVTAAEHLAEEESVQVPLIGTGHLFAAGGQVADGDDVRDIYVGSLDYVPASIFPDILSYVALGHLHSAQLVDKQERIQYSGTPIPMGFHEASKEKSVTIIDFDQQHISELRHVSLPRFQILKRVSGDLKTIQDALSELMRQPDEDIWVEVEYNGSDIASNLAELVHEQVTDSHIRILKVLNRTMRERNRERFHTDVELADITPEDVMEKLLLSEEQDGEKCEELLGLFRETLTAVQEQDVCAE
jgi:exonuclease SbcD